MLDLSKIRAVQNYLQCEFPTCTVENSYKPDSGDQIFRISGETILHLVTVTGEFVKYTEDIPCALEELRLAEAIRRTWRRHVLVTSGGLRIQKE